MPFFRFLPPSTIEALLPLANELGVSSRGFASAYAKAGSHESLGEYWKAKRSATVARLLGAKNAGPMWKGNIPTRAHLVLIMWGYSPTPERLQTFVDAMEQRAEA